MTRQTAMTLPAGYTDWRTLPMWRTIGLQRELLAMFLAHRRLPAAADLWLKAINQTVAR
jgi:hypothetical protein